MALMKSDRLLLSTSRFDVVERTYHTARGTHTRAVIEHPGAVCILPLLDDGRLVLLRNHRAAVDQWLVEIPAGTCETGEEPSATALRELAEETGYSAAELVHVCDFWMSPGILKERMHFFVARQLTSGQQSLDEGESIETVVVGYQEALAMIRSGQIEDAKTIVALLYYEQFLRMQGNS